MASFFGPFGGPGGGAAVSFAGRAPGMAGVDQVNVLVPAAAPEGCAVPLSYDPWSSQNAGPRTNHFAATIPVSIHSGGGQCVDPPSSSLGQLLLKRSVVLNDNSVPESDSLLASFSASPYQKLASTPVFSSGDLALQATTICPQAGYLMLDAGAIGVTGPFGSRQPAQPSARNGAYQVALPAGAVQAGTFTASSAGGKDVGAFQTNLQMPEGIQITTSIPKGTVVVTAANISLTPLSVSWTGGAPGQVVTLKLIGHRAGGGDVINFIQAPATAGRVAFGFSCAGFHPPICLLQADPSPDADLVVELGPDPKALPTFSAPGPSLGGLAGWVYEYRFTGLSVPPF